MTKAIQILGTGSAVGKSIIVTALCRIFLQDGYRVCPFKAQNMSLNSYVTSDGREMGRAQVVQAQASRIEPDADMNPILIKPTTDKAAQIILQGKPFRNMSARQYQNSRQKANLLKKVKASFNRLKQKYELMVIEGAGSPVEINLKAHDIVNMKMAQLASAPVLLVGDIDKGGVFASFVGTLELWFIINKFRGDKTLLKEGIRFLEQRTGKPVLGVIPYFSAVGGSASGARNIKIPEEDSVPLENRIQATGNGQRATKLIDIAVIKLPHISNFTDFDILEKEEDVQLRYITNKYELDSPDLIIIPGTKNTIKDLIWLKQSGLAQQILSTVDYRLSTNLIGICGGYQMLGTIIRDPEGIESRQKEIQGLGLLPIVTQFSQDKMLSQVRAEEVRSGFKVCGYEIHHGRTKKLKNCQPIFQIIERKDREIEDFDGAMRADGKVWGTYIHGVFDSDDFRRNFLNRLRISKGWLPISQATTFNLDNEFDKLAKLVRENLNMDLLYKILNHNL